MPAKIPLETGIYQILSDDRGLSHKTLLSELVKYSERLKEYDLVLKVNGGSLSRKLKILRDKQVVYEYDDLYYIKRGSGSVYIYNKAFGRGYRYHFI